jgi:flagellar biosynthetic protein FliQ
MSSSDVLIISKDLMWTALLLAAPAVITSLVVGLVISVLQTLTSIQEQTLSFVPRIVVVSLVMLVTLPWSLQVAISFSIRMMAMAAKVGH